MRPLHTGTDSDPDTAESDTSSHKPMKPLCFLSIKNVWADSYKVGCAAQACPNGVAETGFSTKPGIIFVCNYATA